MMESELEYRPLTYKDTTVSTAPVMLPIMSINFDLDSIAQEVFEKFEKKDYVGLGKLIMETYPRINPNQGMVGQIIATHQTHEGSDIIHLRREDDKYQPLQGPVYDEVATDLVMYTIGFIYAGNSMDTDLMNNIFKYTLFMVTMLEQEKCPKTISQEKHENSTELTKQILTNMNYGRPR